MVNDMGVTEGKYDYEPFGKKMTVLNNKNRLTFIGKENDFESNFGDFGVRKYDDETGRFTSVDILWENDIAWTPYHYCWNNPVLLIDDNGYQGGFPLPSPAGPLPAPPPPIPINQGDSRAIANSIKEFVNDLIYTAYGQYSKPAAVDQQANCHAVAQGTPADQPVVKVSHGSIQTGTPPPPPAPQPEPEKKEDKKAPSNNQIQKMIEKKQTPKSVERIDYKGLKANEKVHIHLKGDHALNIDGTWKHGGRTLTNKEINFFKKIEWNLPKK